jgi:hypothetical protein
MSLPESHGAPSGELNGYDWKHIGLVFVAALIGFLLTWITSVLIPDLQNHGVISAALGLFLTTCAAAIQRLINDGKAVTRLVLIGLSLSLLNSAGLADDVVLQGLAPGTYYAKITVAADGSMTVLPLRSVTLGPTPTPPPGPNPSPLSDRAKAIMAAAQQVPTTGNPSDPDAANTALGYAKLLQAVAQMAPQAGTPKALEDALKQGTDQFLSLRGGTAAKAWEPVRGVLSLQLTQLDFNKAALSEYAQLLNEAAAGLNASVPVNKRIAIDPQLLQLIIAIINIIAALLKIPVPPLPTP